MKDLRIIFMGTPGFAVATLKELLENGYKIVGVITSPDKPAGRGRKIRESEVKQYAKSAGLNILQPTNLKDPQFIKELEALKANLQIVVAFRMLPKAVWNMPEYGTFNLHASLLPKYRGAAPINWALINGENKSGVTTFFLDEKIDTGAIILQQEVEIKEDYNAGDLHDILMEEGAELVLKTVKLIEEDKVITQPQEKAEVSPAPKLFKENCKINWNNQAQDIYNFIRGLSPFPAAWSFLTNKGEDIEIKIYKTEYRLSDHQLAVGKIIAQQKELKVAVKDGFIKILELKAAGKRKMDSLSFLNGYKLSEDAMMH
ncbi:MAG: methionyl-tRNA formyltransferase [Flavobacteriia bacterium]|nr:MAG: methionyl-tRNA formyltransferase [Flavobacteriia bacterium]